MATKGWHGGLTASCGSLELVSGCPHVGCWGLTGPGRREVQTDTRRPDPEPAETGPTRALSVMPRPSSVRTGPGKGGAAQHLRPGSATPSPLGCRCIRLPPLTGKESAGLMLGRVCGVGTASPARHFCCWACRLWPLARFFLLPGKGGLLSPGSQGGSPGLRVGHRVYVRPHGPNFQFGQMSSDIWCRLPFSFNFFF